ncbi:hypothetical protein [Tessaracoccus palaemonis]|uniref:Uncharacterized protein n=1 Tax=Tessaracoccus palaemonis TaxID=2829499 RepID=A0ABX8SKH3_9ACTN|nr:hypothetical protein [Tessaracoccus palaemonis]QXT63785.1 hypothetical protein KDB89_04750 [Tessaracoccus palaemonis]
MTAVTQLDTTTGPDALRAVTSYVNSIYQESDLGNPVALFARCQLGEPYLDHLMSLDGTILTHFKRSEALAPHLAAARALARSDAYAFIEVYDDGSLVPVRANGQPIT